MKRAPKNYVSSMLELHQNNKTHLVPLNPRLIMTSFVSSPTFGRCPNSFVVLLHSSMMKGSHSPMPPGAAQTSGCHTFTKHTRPFRIAKRRPSRQFLDPNRQRLHIYQPAHVAQIPGHFARLLARGTRAGMFNWTAVASESTAQRRRMNLIAMSAFAVTKDEDSDRLISWPRFQNALLPPPPTVDLPTPDLFGRLHISPSMKCAAFAADVSNMFHNILLPPWLSNIFAFPPMAFGNLPGETQHHIMQSLKLTVRPRKHHCSDQSSEHYPWGSLGRFILHTK